MRLLVLSVTLSTEPVKLARPESASPLDRSVRRDREEPERSSTAPLTALPTDDASAMPSAALAATEVPKALGSALNLALSREAQKFLATPGLAARSPFQGHFPATVERQIAEAGAETGPWTEERIDSDHRGARCCDLNRLRLRTRSELKTYRSWCRQGLGKLTDQCQSEALAIQLC